jgi:hypothetical protein
MIFLFRAEHCDTLLQTAIFFSRNGTKLQHLYVADIRWAGSIAGSTGSIGHFFCLLKTGFFEAAVCLIAVIGYGGKTTEMALFKLDFPDELNFGFAERIDFEAFRYIANLAHFHCLLSS